MELYTLLVLDNVKKIFCIYLKLWHMQKKYKSVKDT